MNNIRHFDFDKYIVSKRRKKSTIEGRCIDEEIASDRSRILFSTAFRRMQRKTQVHPLEEGTFVRNRLTHSLEVADTGKNIAYKVAKTLKAQPKYLFAFANAVENACLMHDIGNPPFGHFGEVAIQDWFNKNWESTLSKSLLNETQQCSDCKEDTDQKALIEHCIETFRDKYLPDFINFDGNAQGFRIAVKLQSDRNDPNGLNLTTTTLLSYLKYPYSTDEYSKDTTNKKFNKPGIFISEKVAYSDIINLHDWVDNIGKRFPLVYIMEAADDIAYSIADIEDGIEKGMINSDDFMRYYHKRISNNYIKSDINDFFLFKTTLTRKLIADVAQVFCENISFFLEGNDNKIMKKIPEAKIILDELTKYAKKHIYLSKVVEEREIAGYQIIHGILDSMSAVLQLSRSDFKKMISDDKKGKKIESKLVNRLPKKFVENYRNETAEAKCVEEWFLRAHLIVDYIAGMTDIYALETYQLFKGIRIEKS